MGQESGSGLAGCFWLKISHKVSIGALAGAAISSESLPEVDPISELSVTLWWSTGFRSSWAVEQRVSVFHWLLLAGLPQFLWMWASSQIRHDVVAALSQHEQE